MKVKLVLGKGMKTSIELNTLVEEIAGLIEFDGLANTDRRYFYHFIIEAFPRPLADEVLTAFFDGFPNNVTIKSLQFVKNNKFFILFELFSINKYRIDEAIDIVENRSPVEHQFKIVSNTIEFNLKEYENVSEIVRFLFDDIW